MVARAQHSIDLDAIWRPILRTGVERFVQNSRGRAIRSRVDFCRDCIRLVEGRHKGKRWRPKYQPWAYHMLNLMDVSGYRKFRTTACVQSGKSTNCSVVNILWHLFERREDVIAGIPQLKMAENAWDTKIKPVIQKSPELRAYLPTSGAGSRGGFTDLIKFSNGATLKFMGGGGSDDERSSHTAPVIVKFEVDRYDTPPAVSREGPPVEQMENRTEAFGDLAWSYEECTVTVEDGRIWLEISDGTGTLLHYECVHCNRWVRPEREHFVGVEDCEDVKQARKMGAFQCPECKALFSEKERQLMLDRALPVHRGQRLSRGKHGGLILEGDPPPTDRLSFRANAFDNRFWTTAGIAAGEWRAMYATKQTEMDKNRRQMAWALPTVSEELDLTPLTLSIIVKRGVNYGMRVVPPNTRWVTCGADVRKTEQHFVVRAWTQVERDDHLIVQGHAFDMGTLPVHSKTVGVRMAVIDALKRFRDERILRGYLDDEGQKFVPGWTLVDGGWQERAIWEFMLDCAEQKIKGFMPILGRGQSEPPGKGSYVHPDETNSKVLWIGENCHIRKSSRYAELFAMAGAQHEPTFVMANSDEWKAFVRDGYETPEGEAGALTTFKPTTAEEEKLRLDYGHQIISEKRVRRVVPKRGTVEVFINESRRPNHYGDCDYYGAVAGNLMRIPIAVKRRAASSASQQTRDPLTMPDGRAYMELAA